MDNEHSSQYVLHAYSCFFLSEWKSQAPPLCKQAVTHRAKWRRERQAKILDQKCVLRSILSAAMATHYQLKFLYQNNYSIYLVIEILCINHQCISCIPTFYFPLPRLKSFCQFQLVKFHLHWSVYCSDNTSSPKPGSL